MLITGGLGFVGSELTRTLLRTAGVDQVILLARPQAGLDAAARFARLVGHWRRFVEVPDAAALGRLRIVEADLEDPAATLRFDAQVDIVVHAAADTHLDSPLALSRRANVFMTQRVLRLAAGLPGLQRFVHLSTAYVCGTRRGVVREADGPTASFHNNYERTKYEGEDAVRCSGLPYTILRPSIIVGRSDSGYIPGTQVLYSVWRMWLSGHIPRAPIDPKAWVDIVPLDFVVAATWALARNPAAVGRCLHLCAGADRQSPKTVMIAATEAFGVPLPPISPAWAARVLRLPPVRPFVAHALREILEAMSWHLPYLGMRGRRFDMTATDGLLAGSGVVCPQFADYGRTVFRFCRDTAWGKRPRPGPGRGGAEDLEAGAGTREEAACSASA